MAKLLYAVALALTLCLSAAAAKAETHLALVQRTFDALKQSATALDRGDLGKATTLLAGMKSSAETLRGTAEQFAKQAEATAKLREAEARDMTTQITKIYAAEQAADKEVRNLEAGIADLSKQLEKANATKRELDAQAAVYYQEVRMRQECRSHFAEGIFWSGECWRLSFQDVFANRWRHLNNDIEGNNRQRNDIENARRDLTGQLNAQQGNLNETRRRKAQLEAHRAGLEQQVKTLKAAVVNLTDAASFWTDTATLIGSRITSIGTLQQSVQLLMKRANRTATAPVFDSYDKEEVRSLEATLINFAQTLDKGTNILLKP
jgi:chromosome segregation ATPase